MAEMSTQLHAQDCLHLQIYVVSYILHAFSPEGKIDRLDVSYGTSCSQALLRLNFLYTLFEKTIQSLVTVKETVIPDSSSTDFVPFRGKY